MQYLKSRQSWSSGRPYAAGVAVGGLVFLAGHVPVDSAGATAGSNVGDQASVVLENLERTLRAAGLGRETIVSTTVYLTRIADIDQLDEAYRDFFGPDGPHPSRTTVQISSLGRPEFAVEISAIAVGPI